LRRGFLSKDLNLAVLGYEDLKLVRPPSFSPVAQNFASSLRFGLANVGWGDYVVHEEYGVGKYIGLSFVGKKENQQDSVAIEFADGGVVNVALDCFDKIHKYTSGGEGQYKAFSSWFRCVEK
jgi:transcription-repair coupling factor (superfamily II helicase)